MRYIIRKGKMRLLLLSIYLLFYSFIYGQSHWETIVRANNNWTYLVGDSEPPTDWYTEDFDDTGWAQSTGSFGYGDNDDSTIINVSYSLYIRTVFQIVDVAEIDSLILDIDFDDGFVAYLNGEVIARSYNLNTDFPAYNNSLSEGHNAVMIEGGVPTRIGLDKSILKTGDNILSIQGINVSPTSSDFSLAPFLHIKRNASDILYFAVPEWFTDPDEKFTSNLPIIVIETENGQSIPDEPKINAHLGIIHTDGQMNPFPGEYNQYDGLIGIELRGQTSQNFPKKGYGFETRLPNGENNNVELLGLPEENDWVLHGPYSDKSLMRNVLIYYFARKMGQYAPRTRFCELFINNNYRGVYVLIEKIKRDTLRLDIGKLTPDEVSGRDVTGGYIVKIDKGDDPFWTSPYLSINNNNIDFIYVYPKPEDISQEQKQYIEDFFTAFEDALYQEDFSDNAVDYRSFIDMKSFVDYYLINELSKNVDAYRLSTYFHKDKDRKNEISPLRAGPVWDYNLALGNADYYDASTITGWRSDHRADEKAPPFWWARFKEDPQYHNLMVDMWSQYRKTILSDTRVDEVIDSLSTLLEQAQQRNFATFPVLSSYVWPNAYIGNTYASEIAYVKRWMHDRMNWMDGQLNNYMDPLPGGDISGLSSTSIDHKSFALEAFPNPFTESLSLTFELEESSEVEIHIQNVMGNKLLVKRNTLPEGEQVFEIEKELIGSNLPDKGTYFLQLWINGELTVTKVILKY